MKIIALAAAIVASSAGLLGTPAAATTDTTPPVWTKPPTNSMNVGAQVNPAILGDCDSWSIPVKVSWTAQDPESGIAHYGYSLYDSGSEDATITKKTSRNLTTWVVDDVCGGGGSEQNFYAWNGAGLHSSWLWGDQGLKVVQDDSLTQTLSQPWIRYNGAWSTSACNCWSGGTTQKTTQSGASAVLTLPYDPFGDGRDYGLGVLMARGPDRGKAAVFVDNVKVATVDTYSSSKLNRTVVWRSTTSKATETIKVVNLATPGRPRVDVDAFILLQKQPGFALNPDVY
jgi:hypothetical protein